MKQKATFLKNIDMLCDCKHLTREELDQQLGLPRGTIENLETSSLNLDGLARLANAFQIPVDTLLRIDLSVLSQSEQEILQYVNLLERKTEAHELLWEPVPIQDWESELAEYARQAKQGNGSAFRKLKWSYFSHDFQGNAFFNGGYRLCIDDATQLFFLSFTASPNGQMQMSNELWVQGTPEESQFIVGSYSSSTFFEPLERLRQAVQGTICKPKLKSAVREKLETFFGEAE